MDLNLSARVFDISSDEEVDDWGKAKDAAVPDIDIDLFGDISWISDLLTDDDGAKIADDSDDVVLVEEVLPNPNGRPKSSDAVAKPVIDDDDDCVVLDYDPDKPVSIQNDPGSDSDDVLFVAQKGQIACRDYPHPRHLCANFPFNSTPHEKHCEQCHCYVCDSRAPCIHWGSGTSCMDHCHATDDDGLWTAQRKSFKNGEKQPPPVPRMKVGLSQVIPISPMISLPNQVDGSFLWKPNSIRPCTSTNFANSNIILNQGDHGRVFSGSNGHLIAPQLSTADGRRRNVNSLACQINSPRGVFKRMGSAGVVSRTSRFGNVADRHGSPYHRNIPSGTTSNNGNFSSRIAATMRNVVRCQDFDSVMAPMPDTRWSSSRAQPTSGSVTADSVYAQFRAPSQSNMAGMFANSSPSQDQISSQLQESCQPFVGSLINLVPPPLQETRPYAGSETANTFSPQPSASACINVGSLSVGLTLSHPQAFDQSSLASNFSQNAFWRGNQTELVPCVGSTHSGSSLATATGRSIEQTPPRPSQLEIVAPTSEPPFFTDFDPLYNGHTDHRPFLVDDVDWLWNEPPLPIPPETPMASGCYPY